jgi:hypothetical protein
MNDREKISTTKYTKNTKENSIFFMDIGFMSNAHNSC